MKMGTTKTKQEQIKGRQIGRNVIITIGRDKYSRAFKNKKDREHILNEVEAYNKRNSKKRLKEIISLMTADKATTEKKKAETRTKVKEVKKGKPAPNFADRVATNMEIAAAQKLLIDNGYTVAKASPKRRSGEY